MSLADARRESQILAVLHAQDDRCLVLEAEAARGADKFQEERDLQALYKRFVLLHSLLWSASPHVSATPDDSRRFWPVKSPDMPP